MRFLKCCRQRWPCDRPERERTESGSKSDHNRILSHTPASTQTSVVRRFLLAVFARAAGHAASVRRPGWFCVAAHREQTPGSFVGRGGRQFPVSWRGRSVEFLDGCFRCIRYAGRRDNDSAFDRTDRPGRNEFRWFRVQMWIWLRVCAFGGPDLSVTVGIGHPVTLRQIHAVVFQQ